jgi:tetratricopeptide (TPR) repeat protein
MFVVTFYSYKGGVGRTSALVNVAYRLASRGKRVFVLDFDLEAPGVDAYDVFESDVPRDGIVEYIGQFMNTGEVPALEKFVIKGKQPGLFFMPAGKKDNQYQSFLSQLNWKILYRSKKGYLFVENLKAAIKDIFAPDYVFVDSRTGLTDISGICTLQLPDLDLLIFSLNRQNIDGIAQIYRSIKDNKLRRSISTLLVASPVPDVPESVTVRKGRFECARQTIGSPVDVILPYDPYLAFQEAIIKGSDTHLGKSYDFLTDRIISANPTDVVTLLKIANEFKDAGSFDLAELHFQEVIESHPKDPIAWIEAAKFARVRGRLQDACGYLERALVLRPNDPDILGQLAITYLSLDKSKAAKYYATFLENARDNTLIDRVAGVFRNSDDLGEAVEGYKRMLQIEPNNRSAYIDLGETRMRMKHYREAIEAYSHALALEPAGLIPNYNLGFALSRVGDPRGREYFEAAIRLFEQMDMSSKTRLWVTNALEAMSHAYIGTGRPEKALELLKQAIESAEHLGAARVFSSLEYRYIPVSRFIEEAKALMKVAEKTAEERRISEKADGTTYKQDDGKNMVN